MNKIKLIYDVVSTMKEKENIIGTFTAAGKKDQVQFLNVNNQFQKNLVNGEVKAKINVDLDAEGKKVKHESSVEFNSDGHPEGMHRQFGKHFRQHHGGMHHHNFKDQLSALTFALKILNDMQIDEQPDYTLITLNLNEFPEELKAIHGKMDQNMAEEHHKRHFPIKEFISMEKTNAAITIQINKNKEIEKIDLTVEGNQKDEQDVMHSLNLDGELQFSW